MPKVNLNPTAPNFTLEDSTGEPFRLSDLFGKYDVLLIFNRTFT